MKPDASLRVLLIEDSPTDALLLKETLTGGPGLGEIETVARLDEALQRLDQERFDVALADLSLPDSHGLETFRRLHAHSSRVPIIVLSGLDDEALALRTVEEGAQDYLVKGRSDQAALFRAIRYAISRAELDDALKNERNLLRSVIDNLIDAIYVKDTSGRFLLGNLAHARSLGFASPEEIVGCSTAEMFPPEAARRFQADDERVMHTGQPILNQHERIAEPGEPVRWLSTTKVPMRDAQGRIVGIIGIGRDITARKLAEEQLARSAEELRARNAEMEEDLDMAREVQQAFLPQQFPVFPPSVSPEETALRFYSRYLPTTALGGDFFHVQPISDYQAGIFICDVMGHGVRAALVTAIHRALVEELTPFAADPGVFLTRMNDALVSILRKTRSPMFASAFYIVVDTERGVMRYANAGHPLPLHLRRSDGRAVLLEGPGEHPGPALGVFEGSVYDTQDRPVGHRDVVMLFTDGLYEVENSRGELFDHALLVETVEAHSGRPIEEVFDQTIARARAFSITRNFIDDVCLVGVEVMKIMEKAREESCA